jgi:hypothetical protein
MAASRMSGCSGSTYVCDITAVSAPLSRTRSCAARKRKHRLATTRSVWVLHMSGILCQGARTAGSAPRGPEVRADSTTALKQKFSKGVWRRRSRTASDSAPMIVAVRGGGDGRERVCSDARRR